MITKYRVYSNQELLLLLEDKRIYSPVIDELCKRLEFEPTLCPICDTDLLKYNLDTEE